jgi:hypothetical protein
MEVTCTCGCCERCVAPVAMPPTQPTIEPSLQEVPIPPTNPTPNIGLQSPIPPGQPQPIVEADEFVPYYPVHLNGI